MKLQNEEDPIKLSIFLENWLKTAVNWPCAWKKSNIIPKCMLYLSYHNRVYIFELGRCSLIEIKISYKYEYVIFLSFLFFYAVEFNHLNCATQTPTHFSTKLTVCCARLNFLQNFDILDKYLINRILFNWLVYFPT